MGGCGSKPADGIDSNFKVKLGAVFPNFQCKTTKGDFKFHDFLSESPAWTVLFSHPADFTPVCTTELGKCHELVETLKSRGVKLIGLSCDSVEEHHKWSEDVLAAGGFEGKELGFPIIADPSREIAVALGMLDPLERGADGIPKPARALFFIGPNKTNRLTILYPATTGRNFVEVLRVMDSLFYTQDFKLATPVNWKDGERMIVAPSVTTDEAKQKFQNLEIKTLPSGKEYLRYVDALPAPVSSAAAEQAPELPKVPGSAAEFTIKLGAAFPDFDCKTTKGDFKFHKFLEEGEEKWTCLFSHPKDFTPVCTTEMGMCHKMVNEFKARGVKLIGLSCDTVEEHKVWSKDVLAAAGEGGEELAFPIIADEKRELAAMLGMLDPLERDGTAMPLPARALFVIGPDKTNRLTLLYPATTGRDFNEVLRTIDSLKYTADFSLATPVNWQPGDRVIVAPTIPMDKVKEDPVKFANLEIKQLPSGKEYLRYVDCPKA
jgi:1-Cys peroxiredoxin 6